MKGSNGPKLTPLNRHTQGSFVPQLNHTQRTYAPKSLAPTQLSAAENLCNHMLSGCVLKIVLKHSFAITVFAATFQNTVFNTAIQLTQTQFNAPSKVCIKCV
jgi:hypothetical protein